MNSSKIDEPVIVSGNELPGPFRVLVFLFLLSLVSVIDLIIYRRTA